MAKKIEKQLGMIPELYQDIYKGIKSKSGELKENSLVKKSLSKALGADVEMELETGEKVEVTVIDVIVANTLQDAVRKPSTSKLKDLAAITGELKENVELNLRGADQLFGDIVNKE